MIAPRHPHRGPTIERMAADAGLTAARRSTGALPDTLTEIYIADTMGEMGSLFTLADTVFIAGSFVPVGGHNPLEPAHFGKPVMFGPLMAKNADIAADMIAAGVAEEVADGVALGERIVALMQDDEQRNAITRAALAFVQGQSKIAEDMAERIISAVNRRGRPGAVHGGSTS